MGGYDVCGEGNVPLASLLLEIDKAGQIKITVTGDVKYLISKLDYEEIVFALGRNKKSSG